MVFFYQPQLIPCIIRPPSGVVGWESKALTDQFDIVATLLDIAGAKPPVQPHGISLVPQIHAGSKSPIAHKGKEAVFTEVFGFSTVVTDKFMMGIEAKSLQIVELYDLQSDPAELNNLVNDPSLGVVKNELFEKYLQQLIKTRDEKLLDDYFERAKTLRGWA